MTAKEYEACTRWLSHTPRRAKIFGWLFRLLPVGIAVAYGVLVILLFWTDHWLKWRFLVVPALTFLLVTLLRKWLNFPRPYDQLKYTPFLSAQPGKGKSFPSRHTASASAIALAFYQISPWLGTVLMILALVVAVSRVVGGAHYIRDTAVGFFLSFLFLPLYFIG